MLATGTLQGTYSGIYPEDVRLIPIKHISETQQKPIIQLVDTMLSLNKHLNEIRDKKTDERVRIEEEIKKTNKKLVNLCIISVV